MKEPEESDVIIDWSNCTLVEVIPGKVSGAPILVGTRVPADGIVVNYADGSTIEEISENFDIPEETSAKSSPTPLCKTPQSGCEGLSPTLTS